MDGDLSGYCSEGCGMKTVITFTNENGSYAVSVPRGEMTANDVITDLLIPVLLAAQYSRECIEEAMSG